MSQDMNQTSENSQWDHSNLCNIYILYEKKNKKNKKIKISNTSAFVTCIQKYVMARYVCLIVFMVIAQTHVQAVATVH